MEAIHLQLHYYNNQRIDTSLKAIPALYKQQSIISDKVS